MTNQFQRFLNCLLTETLSAINTDLGGNTKLQKARWAGAYEAISKCRGKTPDQIADVCDEEPRQIVGDFKMEIYAAAEKERTLAWIAHCVSAWMAMRGMKPLVTMINPHACYSAMKICQENLCEI